MNEKYFYILCRKLRNKKRHYIECFSLCHEFNLPCWICKKRNDKNEEGEGNKLVRSCESCVKLARWHVSDKWRILEMLKYYTILTRDVLKIIEKFTWPIFQ